MMFFVAVGPIFGLFIALSLGIGAFVAMVRAAAYHIKRLKK